MRTAPRLIFLAALVLAALAGSATGAGSHAPVRATGDAALAALAAQEGWPGDGTAASPYVVSGLFITASGGAGFELAHTRAHVVLRELHVASGGSTSDGLRLVNASNVTIEDSVFESNRYGVHARASFDVTLQRSTVKSSQVGVYLETTTRATLLDNRVSVNDHDVRFKQSARNVLRNNNLSTATGQVGLFFEDNASYENSIDATNVVNAIPVRWYSGLAGTPESPVVIPGIQVDLKGITNVAQVMVHNSTHVVLDAPVAKAGTGAGIVLHGSVGARVTRATLDGNLLYGIVVEGGSGARIDNSTLRGNGAGASFHHTVSATLEDSRVLNHTREGVRVAADSADILLRADEIAGNAARGVLVERAAAIRVEASALDSNAIADVSLDLAQNVTVAGNVFTGPSESGVSLTRTTGTFEANAFSGKTAAFRLAQTTGSVFRGNLVTLGPAQFGFHFDGEASYDNEIEPGNLVNGVPVRWYVRANGTAAEPRVLSGVSVDVRGITNVAQVMVYRSSNVTLVSAIARNGTAAGFAVHGSDNVTIASSRASENGAHGILARQSPGMRILASRSELNGADGAQLVGSPRASIESTLFEGNRGRGLLLDESPAATLRENGAVGNREAGVHVLRSGAAPTLVEGTLFEGNLGGGLLAESSTLGQVKRNVLAANGPFGIQLRSVAPGAAIEENALEGHVRGIRLASTQGVAFGANRLQIAAGEHGFWFDDETSYNVTLAPSNLVNGVPVRWYVGLAGTPQAPVVLPGLDVQVPGITNVAQVMLYKASHVRLEGVVAAHGSERGVYAFRSDNVTLAGVRAFNNTRHGLHAQAAPAFAVEGATSSGNRGKGVLLEASPGGRLSNVTAEGNGDWGIHLLNSGPAPSRIEDATLRLNKGGVRVEASNLTLLARSLLMHNGDAGIQLVGAAPEARIVDNQLVNHTRGVQLTASPRGVYERNELTIGADQFGLHFGDEASYNSTIATTNRVNGAPVQWHTGLRGSAEGPQVIANVSAEVRGITNVAQVMVYRSSDVRLENVTVANATAAGIRIHESDRVRVNHSSSTRASAAGVHVHLGANVTVQNTTVLGSGGDGILFSGSPRGLADNVTSSESAGHGIQFASAPGAGVRNSTFVGNARSGAHFVGVADVDARLNRLEGNRLRGLAIEGATGANFVADNVAVGNLLEGLSIETASFARVLRNDATANGAAGIILKSLGPGARVEENRVAENARGIQLATTEFAELRSNNVTIEPGQTGLHFSDETSYNNVIETSNTVNGVPVRWYTTLAGTESRPVDLSGVRVELRGMTNVAQVMVYKSAYVRLSDVVAANGTARGVLLYRSSNVLLESSRITDNAVGVHLHATQSSTVRSLNASGSAIGVRLTASLSNVVSSILAPQAETGVVVGDLDSRSNRIDQIHVSGRARGVSDPSVSGTRANNLIADAGATKRAKVGANVSFADNTGATRFESERIVDQTWHFGDGSTARCDQAGCASSGAGASLENPAGALFRPVHAYASPGEHVATYVLRTADGTVLSDTVVVDVVPPLSEPVGLMAGLGAKNASLSWLAPASDGASPVLKYRIYRGPNATGLAFLAEVGPVTSYLDTAGVAADGSHHYAVSAVNAEGEGPRSPVVLAAPAAPPGPVATLSAAARAGNVTLGWEPPQHDGGMRITGYRIHRAAPGNAFGVLAHVENVTSYADTRVVNGQPYVYAIEAVNGMGIGPMSGNVTVFPTGAPSAPRLLGVTASDASASLVWGPPADDGGSPLLRYRVHRGLAPDALSPVADVGNATAWTDTGLANGRTYYFAVTALNANGEGNRSAVLGVTPDSTDTRSPVFLALEPAAGATLLDGRLALSAAFSDNQGVNVSSVRLVLDDVDVTEAADVTPTSLAYAHPETLAPGQHVVRLSLRDAAGNEANATWTLRVPAPDEVRPLLRVTNLTLDPAQAAPGAAVNATALVENVGFAPYNGSVALRDGDVELAVVPLELAPGANATLLFAFLAGGEGNRTLHVGDANATLVVTAPAPPPGTEAPGDESEPVDGNATTPGRSLRPPSRLPVPAPGALALLAVGALAACARRR